LTAWAAASRMTGNSGGLPPLVPRRSRCPPADRNLGHHRARYLHGGCRVRWGRALDEHDRARGRRDLTPEPGFEREIAAGARADQPTLGRTPVPSSIRVGPP